MIQNKKVEVRVGVAGWSYPDWQGVVYPAGKDSTRDNLKYIADFVDAIEINTTFYRPPDRRAVASWVDRVSKLNDFIFTAKLWQRFTHSRDEQWRPAELEDFLDRISPLFESGKGGTLLAQFPHSFHRSQDNMEYIKVLIEQIRDIPVTVELRHDTWNDETTFAMLQKLGAGLCSIDQPMFRNSLGPIERVTGDIAYIRLHGRNKANWFSEKAGRDERYDYLYSPKELVEWSERAKKMAQKAQNVYVITNNHFRGQAVCNALIIKALLTEKRVRAPASLLEHYPELKEYASPDTPMQEMLF